MSGFRLRYLGPVVLTTLCLVSLCGITAVSLFYQQAAVTQVLREEFTSRKAASDLRSTLNVLIALETNHVETVSDLHTRAQAQIADTRRHADTPTEQGLTEQMGDGFGQYLHLWQSLPPPAAADHEARVADATRFLEARVLVPCRELEEYNDSRVEEAVREHEQTLRNMVWGLATVAGLGGFAGVVLGFGVARGLSRSIRRLEVQIRDAAGKFGPDPAEIVVTGDGDFHGLHAQLDQLAGRIEEAVQTLRQRDREVLRAEQLAAVGQLAAGVAHEIRNPLTSIKMLVQAGLEDGAGLTAADMRVIEGEVRRTERSLQTFLDFARPPKPRREQFDLTALVGGVVELIRGRAVKQRVAVAADAPPAVTLTGDVEQFRQVLVNLCLNALDAMPTGGRLTVAVRPRPGRVEVSVDDTGPGIPREILPRLFEPFVSSKDTGLGLGLVISRRIAEDHGGTILASNLPGGGAGFLVSVPTTLPARPDADTPGR
ncbi:MAG: ATP-binding protein [Gemmataceae bacterium]